MLTLYQAEWCPYSSAVRERLTELGIDFVAKQVAPYPEQRGDVETIPTLVDDGGERHEGTRACFALLAGLEPGEYERTHRRRYAEHAQARETDATGQILAKAAPLRR
ncbi:MAG TPA: glutaredoxin domain-containing protein [Gaiellaceae bacterium]|nr:glutaredoxin domain-containing protein [Gaiellaceae bacterium]